MNNLVPIEQSRAPTLRGRAGGGLTTGNFSEGVQDSFPRLSIRGKSFFIRMNNADTPCGSHHPDLGPILDIILVNGSRQLAKSYYDKPYTGDTEQPTCWSLDSIRPDPTVVQKQNDLCQTCKMNEFGTAKGGRGGKACQDSRRVIVTTAQDLTYQEPAMLMLRVP